MISKTIILKMKHIRLSFVLSDLMKKKSVTHTQLSKQCSIPKSTLSTYLSGKKASYSADHLIALASYFEVSVDYLLTGSQSDVSFLETMKTEGLFEGWLKVKIERAIPNKKDGGK